MLLNGKLQGKPTIIVAGRSDALVPINNNSRAYVAYNKVQDGATSKVSYIEVANAQHFDTFIPFSGFDNRFVPLHGYFVQAMDAMYANLKNGRAAAEPGRSGDATRRRRARRAGDHRSQRAGHQRIAAGGGSDRLRRHFVERSELTRPASGAAARSLRSSRCGATWSHDGVAG